MNEQTSAHDLHGLLVIDKPGGMTSRAAVNHIQRTLPRRTKIGHTGTLDPLATGVLVLCLGHATRLAEYVQAMPKVYRSTFLLGATSDTDDADGVITTRSDVKPIDPAQLVARLSEFVGNIEQTPPAYSAVKVAGQRAHDLARIGSDFELEPRQVHIDRIDIVSYAWPHLDVEVHCGKGTYIRSLARDLGAALGCGGVVTALRRTRVGNFTTEQAISLDAPLELIREKLRPLVDALGEMPCVTVSAEDATRLRQGQAIRIESHRETAVCDATGRLIAICEPDESGTSLHPVKVISAPG